mmetsp:Transcript_17073/g.53452  ORF Transcript_17073/g.53452 Transcript_17073/m.53452 type:complete len:204 (+) Transcript_17073:214-825(+)
MPAEVCVPHGHSMWQEEPLEGGVPALKLAYLGAGSSQRQRWLQTARSCGGATAKGEACSACSLLSTVAGLRGPSAPAVRCKLAVCKRLRAGGGLTRYSRAKSSTSCISRPLCSASTVRVRGSLAGSQRVYTALNHCSTAAAECALLSVRTVLRASALEPAARTEPMESQPRQASAMSSHSRTSSATATSVSTSPGPRPPVQPR